MSPEGAAPDGHGGREGIVASSLTGARDTSGGLRDALVLTRASDVRPEPVRWAWDGRIALGTLNFAVGEPKLGKSTIALEIIARVSQGQLAGDLYGTPHVAIVASAEDSRSRTIVPRLHAAGADLDRVIFVDVRRDGLLGDLAFPDDIEALERAAVKSKAATILVDPLMAHIGATIDSHRDHHVRRALAPLARLADSTGAAVLAIGHLNKAPTVHLFAAIGGSIGLSAAARSILLVTRDPDQEEEEGPSRVIVHAACNLAPEATTLRFAVEAREIVGPAEEPIKTSGIAWHGEAAKVGVRDVLTEDPDAEPGKIAEAIEFLRVELADGPVEAKLVYKSAGALLIADRTLREAKSRLRVQGRKDGFERGWVWALPDPKGPRSESRPFDESFTTNAQVTREVAEVARPPSGKEAVATSGSSRDDIVRDVLTPAGLGRQTGGEG